MHIYLLFGSALFYTWLMLLISEHALTISAAGTDADSGAWINK